MPCSMIRLEGVTKRFGDVVAVDAASFCVERGEVVALLGPSGCGKTTLLRLVAGFERPDAGTVEIDERPVSGPGCWVAPERRRVGMVFQDYALFPHLTVAENVGFGLPRRTRPLRVPELLAIVGLEHVGRRYPHELSGGQRQRVAIASALVLEPELLVADEPVSMLDVSVRAGILALLEELRSTGLGILMITHDLSTAARFADRIAVMYLGRIVEEGPVREVVANPQHPYTKALISVVPKRDPRDRTRPQILTGETPNPIHVPSGCRFHPRCPAVFDRCPHDDPVELLDAGAPGHRAACWLLDLAR